MERIKQALENARQERQQHSGVSAEPMSKMRQASSIESITYTHTKTVEIAKDFLKEKRIISGYEQNAFTDAYKILRTQVLQRLQENNRNSLAITSTGDNEGKTLTAINLAISLAMEVKYTVLLVDADLRNPSVHSYFGLETHPGLSDYLTGEKSLPELLIHPAEVPGLVVLPGGKMLANSSEMLNSPKMARLVAELKTRYPSRIILFDLPPLLSAADAMAFSPYVDAFLLVIEEGKAQSEEVKRSVELLQGCNLIGTVLNKSRAVNTDETSHLHTVKWLSRLLDKIWLMRLPLIDKISRRLGKR